MPLPLFISGGLLASFAVASRLALISALSFFVGKLFLTLGVGFISYSALSPFVNYSFDFVLSLLSFHDERIMNFLGILQVDRILTVWSSAITTKISLISLKKMVFK